MATGTINIKDKVKPIFDKIDKKMHRIASKPLKNAPLWYSLSL